MAALAPWPPEGDLSAPEWDAYIAAARALQSADPPAVERAIDELVGSGLGAGGAADETRAFLLLRVVFDLPERAPEQERRSFKGWVNWPPPDADGSVSLAWPVTFAGGRPALVDPYVGAEGPRYAGVEEYRHLRERYPPRPLGDADAP